MAYRHLKWIVLGFWMSGVVIIFGYFFMSGWTIQRIQQLIEGYIQRWQVLAPIAYILICLIRPLVLFPSTLLTTLSGALFGPVWGIVYTIIGENLSANISFTVGRFFGRNIMEDLVRQKKLIPFLDKRIYENQFMSVLTLRLLFMPFDLVGFMSGFRHLRRLDFALGTFIGILPGLVTFVLLGSSITDPMNLLFTGIAFVTGIAISMVIKKRTPGKLQEA